MTKIKPAFLFIILSIFFTSIAPITSGWVSISVPTTNYGTIVYPTQPAGNNLISLPSFYQSGSWEIDSVYSFYPVTAHGKSNSIQMNRNPNYLVDHAMGINELNGYWTAINPGDHIVFSAWFYVEDQTSSDVNPNRGARFGLDIYGNSGRITEISTPDGQPSYVPSTNTWADVSGSAVLRGTNQWVQRTIDFVVPNYYEYDGFGGPYTTGQHVTPSFFTGGFANWCGTTAEGASGETGRVWIWNPELYITHS